MLNASKPTDGTIFRRYNAPLRDRISGRQRNLRTSLVDTRGDASASDRRAPCGVALLACRQFMHYLISESRGETQTWGINDFWPRGVLAWG